MSSHRKNSTKHHYFCGSVILRQVGDVTFVGDSDDIVINSASGLVKLQLRGSSVTPDKSTLADCPVIFPGTGSPLTKSVCFSNNKLNCGNTLLLRTQKSQCLDLYLPL